MKSLILSAFDKSNGSARAAYRLHQGLMQIGVESQMLVQDKSSNDPQVISNQTRFSQGIAKARVSVDALPLKFYREKQSTLMSLQWLPETVSSKVRYINPDIVNLHWANDGFMQIETIAKFRVPVVWSLHDMWAFTGGCHYTQSCDRYLQSCGACPQLGSRRPLDVSHWVWRRKRQVYRRSNLTVVALSHWLASCARESSVLKDIRVEVIPNGIDTQAYRPVEPRTARQLLNLPQDKKLILFGALKSTSNKRKGFQFLEAALSELKNSSWSNTFELVIIGASQPEDPPDFGFKVHYLGSFSDDLSLALAYSAVDVFVAPSTQENLANTVMESLACGTPCIAFKVGGMPDMIEHSENGYLVQPFDVSDLARGIAWVIEDTERYQRLSNRAREKVETEFTLDIQAHRYAKLFNELIGNQNNND